MPWRQELKVCSDIFTTLTITAPPTLPPAVVNGLIGRVEVLLVRVGECEEVLGESEGRLTECGPIGADLDRLLQQQEILDVSNILVQFYWT